MASFGHAQALPSKVVISDGLPREWTGCKEPGNSALENLISEACDGIRIRIASLQTEITSNLVQLKQAVAQTREHVRPHEEAASSDSNHDSTQRVDTRLPDC